MATVMVGAHQLGFSVFITGITICLLLVTPPVLAQSVVTVSLPGGECETAFMQVLHDCFNNFKIPFNTFLWAATDGTGGIPPEDKAAFSQHMCSVEKDVVGCVLDGLHALVGSESCHEADSEHMASLLTNQVRTIFQEYNNFCADDCRDTLEADLRQCYVDNDIDKGLFLPTDGAIMGDSPYYVSSFCKNKDSLVKCLKAKANACPEAPYVMKKLGLDLDSFKSGLKMLCQKQDVYVSSLNCFSIQTRAVEKCGEEHALTLRRLVYRSEEKGSTVTKQQFLNEFCLARLEFIKCDLTAWESKNVESCNQPALSLKRDIHCDQIPQDCRDIVGSDVEAVCTSSWGRVAVSSSQSSWEDLDSGATRFNVHTFFVAALFLLALAL